MKKPEVKKHFPILQNEEERKRRTAKWVVKSAEAAKECGSAFGFLSSVLHLNDYMTTYSVVEGQSKTKKSRYNEIRFWSKEAIRVKEEREKGIKTTEKLIHEHSIPQSIIEEEIYDILFSKVPEENKIEKVYEILGLCCAAVITKGEDRMLERADLRSKFPETRDKATPLCLSDQLLRYSHVGIKIMDMKDFLVNT